MTERDFLRIPLNETCPFINKLILKEKKRLVKVANLSDTDKTYELHEKDSQGGLALLNTIKIENLVIADEKSFEGSFVKFFRTGFLTSLNDYALRIFVHITEIIELNNNKVCLDIPTITLKCKIDEPRKIYDGLAQLIELRILAKGKIKDIYYVNPSVVFRGSNRRVLFTHKDY